MYYLIFCCFIAFSSLFGGEYPYYVSACAIVQDEQERLIEWIEYHRLLGIEHFWIYDNGSQDDTVKLLQPYVAKGIVEIISWPSPRDQDWTPYQKAAYNHCISQVKHKTRWLAVFDVDEFIVPLAFKNIPEMMHFYGKVGGLQIWWQFFGTSGYSEIPPKKTMIETLTLRAPDLHGPNFNCKTICNPRAVKKYHVHGAEYHSGYHGYWPHGTRGGALQPMHVQFVKINHYWTGPEKNFRLKKVPRRERYDKIPYTEDRIQKTINSLNIIQDTSILKFVPGLRKRLFLD